MEKISAACVMEWSIELEKGLRSKKPGRPIEEIELIGYRIQQWSREPSITKAISDMYGLVPGEDRLFANTILLRLADVFCHGDNHTRLHILKIFLLESKHLIKNGKRYNGILAKRRVPNYMELLKRIKTTFDTGDAEAKTLALRIFGCWADLAKDSDEIRYVILLSLQSSHDSEVKASLFAAGCFCRFSEDFALIVMEMLINIISSMQMASDIKLEAIRVFSKMRCSYSIARKAYKIGKKLVLSLQQDEYKAEMLSSLSKLAYNLPLVIPDQVDLLLSVSSRESSCLVRSKALKCMYFLSNRGACVFPFNETVCAALLNFVGDDELPPNVQCEALRILRKIFRLPDLLDIDMPVIFKLILTVKTAAQSPVKAKRCLALDLLVDSLCNLRKEITTHWCLDTENWYAIFCQSFASLPAGSVPSDDDGPTLLACHVIILIMDCVSFLMDQLMSLRCGKPILTPCDTLLEVKKEIRSLFNLILRLAQEYPSSIRVILDKIRCLISILCRFNENASIPEKVSEMELDGEVHNPIIGSYKSDYKLETSNFSELLLCICRFLDACLSILSESGLFSSELHHMVKLSVDLIQQKGYHIRDMYEIFCLQMHAYVLGKSCEVANNSHDFSESKLGAEVIFSHNVCWVSQEVQALDFAKKMLKMKSHWTVYRVGKHSCCGGVWFTATYAFRKLIDVVESDHFRCWIRSLMLFAGCESEIKLLLFPKVGIEMINVMQTEIHCETRFSSVEQETSWWVGRDSKLSGSEGKLEKVYGRICASEKSLAAAAPSGSFYYFQQWFLSLRAKVLISVVEMLGLLDSHTFNGGKSNNCFEGDAVADLTQVSQLASKFTRISCQLNNLAKEYDLLAVSFLDIDLGSLRCISTLALSCSVLAFCTAFVLYFLTAPVGENFANCRNSNKSEFSVALIIKDLVERLCDIDSTTTAKLEKFMVIFEKVGENLITRTTLNSYGPIDRSVLLVYKSVILSVLRIQEDAKAIDNEEGLCALSVRGLQLLSDIVRNWMEIPFRTPKYFFRIRSCVGAELFVFNADARTDGLSIPPGCHLSLNLCFQLKNASRVSRAPVTKIFCILAVKRADCSIPGLGDRERQAESDFQTCKTDEMLEMKELLLQHMRIDIRNDTQKQCEIDDGLGFLTTTVVHFELNEGKGFSTCTMDVSSLPEGSYWIRWHSCCVDKKGHYWSLLPMNSSFISFTIRNNDVHL